MSVRQKAGERTAGNNEGNRGHILKENYIKDMPNHGQNGHIMHLMYCDPIGQSIYTHKCLFGVSYHNCLNSFSMALAVRLPGRGSDTGLHQLDNSMLQY